MAAALAALVAAAPACLAGDDTLAAIRRAGVVRIGYAVEPPYAFVAPGGDVTGEAPEIARVVARELGVGRVEWRQAEFGELIDGLEAGRYDVIAAGMFVTPARARQVAFSLPTFEVGPALLVRTGNPLGLRGAEDLPHHPAARVAVLSGSVEEARLALAGLRPPRLVRVPDAATGAAMVAAGRADALALSAPTIRWMVRRGGLDQVALVEARGPPGAAWMGRGAFAFRLRDRRLREAWDERLRSFIGTEAHRRLVAPFGFTDAELPGGAGAGGRPSP